jgi:hypothetical protein
MGGESFFDENYGSWYLVRQRTRGNKDEVSEM